MISIYSHGWSSFALNFSHFSYVFPWVSPCLDPSSHATHATHAEPPGIISERQAFAGFASPGVAAYAALFILSEAFAEVKVLDAVMPRAIQKPPKARETRDIPGDIPGDIFLGMKHEDPHMVFWGLRIEKAVVIHFWPWGHDSFS